MTGYRDRGARLDSRKADRMAANYEPGAYRRGDEHDPRSPWFESDDGWGAATPDQEEGGSR